MSSPKTPLNKNLHNKHLHNVIKIPPSPYMKTIGWGTGVAVYELERSPRNDKCRSPWAIKKVTKTKPELQERLILEAEVLRKLSHPNIVGFRAFIKNSDGKNALVMEECTCCLGDIMDTRRDDNLGPFPVNLIVKVCKDMANALDYLHNEALLMHCDIKSYNILIKGNFNVCKLCDFGVCLPVLKDGNVDEDKVVKDEEIQEVEYTGTAAWCPPEVYFSPPIITTKADIYSYGLVIWEMIALSPPYVEENERLLDDSENFDNTNLLAPLKPEEIVKRPPIPEDIELGEEYDKILEIYFLCTQAEREKRPSAKQCVDIFKNINSNSSN